MNGVASQRRRGAVLAPEAFSGRGSDLILSRTCSGALTLHLRTSEILVALVAQPGERLTVGSILSVLRDRAFALLVVLLGLPNCLPMPPPIPLICGLLLALVAVQIVFGRPALWLPKALLHRSISRLDVEKAVTRAVPILQRLERFSRPRITVLENAIAMRAMGVVLLVLAIGIVFALPPIVGQIPLGIAVCLVGLGLVERDGLVVLSGLVVGSIGVTMNLSFVYAIVSSLDTIF